MRNENTDRPAVSKLAANCELCFFTFWTESGYVLPLPILSGCPDSALFATHRYEIVINLFMSLSSRKQMFDLPKC